MKVIPRVGALCSDAERQRARRHASHAAKMDGQIHLLPPGRRRPRLWATPPVNPPQAVMSALLRPKRAGGSRQRTATGGPAVRNNTWRVAFDVESARGRPLELDLGVNCLIDHVSTQGGHPPTRVYPRIIHKKRSCTGEPEIYMVEGRPGWSLAQHGRYEGPFWEILDFKRDGWNKDTSDDAHWTARDRYRDGLGTSLWHHYNQRPLCSAAMRLQWVRRYEIMWRADGGRAWHSLGVFTGNNDAMTEVVHRCGDIKGGLHARYLRFVPLECEGGGALRVGVYGTAATASSDEGDTHMHSMQQGDEYEPITYILKVAPEATCTFTHRKDRRRNKWSRHNWPTQARPSRKRHLRAQEAKETVVSY